MACTGYAIERLGMGITILVSASFPIAAAILLLLIKGKTRPSGVPTPQS
jgi:predicted MFS family arabinose efflux permease